MSPRPTLRRFVRHLLLAAGVALAAAVAGAPAAVAAAPAGSKNFTAPADVPNYFSNEAQSVPGGATARPAQPGVPTLAAPASRRTVTTLSRRTGRHHAGRPGKARGNLRLAHGKAGAHRQLAHAGAVRARVVHARIGHARAATGANAAGSRTVHTQRGPARGKAVAAKTRPAPSKGKSAARARG